MFRYAVAKGKAIVPAELADFPHDDVLDQLEVLRADAEQLVLIRQRPKVEGTQSGRRLARVRDALDEKGWIPLPSKSQDLKLPL